MKSTAALCLFLLSFGFCSPSVWSQTANVVVQGKVVNEQNQPLEFVTVFLLQEGSTQSLKGTVTNGKGEFTLAYAPTAGRFKIGLTYLGYQPFQTPAFLLGNLQLGTLQMKAAEQALKEVKVYSQKNLISAEDGNLTLNVERSIAAQGGTAYDVLSTAPGVTISQDNAISLNGKSGVRLLMDGKLVYLESADLVALLKTLPASAINTIDLLANPGVQFDAAGSAGLINIKTRKNIEFGMNGSATIGVAGWVTPKQNLSFNLNTRKGPWNVYGSYSHLLGAYAYDYTFYREQNGLIYNSPVDDSDTRNRLNASVGIDYQLSRYQTVGLMGSGNLFFALTEGSHTHTRTSIYEEFNQPPIRVLQANNDYYHQRNNRYNTSLNYRFAQDSIGRSLSAALDFGYFDGANKNRQSNTYYSPAGEQEDQGLYRSLSGAGVTLFAVKVDYEDSLAGGKVLAGAKFSSVESDNSFRFFHQLPPGEVLDDHQSNDFNYRERISAVYGSYRFAFSPRVSGQAGLRLEHTKANGALAFRKEEQAAGQMVKNDYLNLFPNVSLSVKANEDSRFSLAFSRRLDRPAYQRLNPFVALVDDLTFWQGNAFLQPQFSNRYSLDYSHANGLVVSLAYSRTNNLIAQVDDTINVTQIVMMPRNVGDQQHYSVNVTRTFKARPWWEVSVNGLFYYVDNFVVFDEKRKFRQDATAYTLNLQQTFRLPKDFTGELSGRYNSATVAGGNKYSRASGQVNVAMKKKLSEAASLSLALTDVFLTNRWNTYSSFNGFFYRNTGHGESRQVRLNFTYGFGKKLPAPKKRDSALDTENNRLN
jgi:outer membrane receptor protein involved in Fe transport